MSVACGDHHLYSPLISYQSPGVSAEFSKILDSAQDLYRYVAGANVAYGHLNELQNSIDSAAATAVTDDWDGEGAVPVARRTLSLARKFASALPSDIRLPEVYPEARGELTFEWRAGKGRITTVSIYPNGTIGYASLIGTSKTYGNESFVSSVPAALVQRISKVFQ